MVRRCFLKRLKIPKLIRRILKENIIQPNKRNSFKKFNQEEPIQKSFTIFQMKNGNYSEIVFLSPSKNRNYLAEEVSHLFGWVNI